MDFPHVAIVMTTYYPDGEDGEKRSLASIQAFRSWEQYLQYEGAPDDHIHVIQADDNEYKNSPNFKLFRGYLVAGTEKQYRRGVGASLNAGFKRAYELLGDDAIVLYAVDDWSLTEPFDLTPWAQLLMERDDVGMVRLGPPHPGTLGIVEAFTGNWQGWAMRLDRRGYAFAHRPALYHKRMIDFYGWFKEDCSAIDCEKDYVDRINSDSGGPDVVLSLPHPWQHIESVELAYIDPKDE